MEEPGFPGDVLRAIARSYRDETGPARAEQLVSRAMARAAEPVPRFKAFGVLAAGATLAVSVLALGLIMLVGNSDPVVSDADPVVAVASDPVSEVSTPEADTLQTPTLPTEELEEALILLEQQREIEAAEVVVRALSSIVVTVVDPDPALLSSSPPSTVAEEQQDRPSSSSAAGHVPPEAGTHPQGSGLDDPQHPEPESTESNSTSQQSGPTSTTTAPEPSIEELGQLLKVEVEELLSADPNDLAAEVEGARKAAQQIQDYGGEPAILIPSSGDDE